MQRPGCGSWRETSASRGAQEFEMTPAADVRLRQPARRDKSLWVDRKNARGRRRRLPGLAGRGQCGRHRPPENRQLEHLLLVRFTGISIPAPATLPDEHLVDMVSSRASLPGRFGPGCLGWPLSSAPTLGDVGVNGAALRHHGRKRRRARSCRATRGSPVGRRCGRTPSRSPGISRQASA